MPVSNDEIIQEIAFPLQDTFKKHGITKILLAEKLKDELEAKEQKVFHGSDGKIKYSKKMIAWQVRQKARQDAHKLMSHYPSEKLDLNHGLSGNMMAIVADMLNKEREE